MTTKCRFESCRGRSCNVAGHSRCLGTEHGSVRHAGRYRSTWRAVNDEHR